MDKDIITKRAFSIVIISFLLSTFVSLWSLREMTQHNSREICRVLAARINDTIVREMSEPVVVAKTMANDRFLMEMMEHEQEYTESEFADRMQAYLYQLQSGLGYEQAFVVSDATKKYYSYMGLLKVVDPDGNKNDAWYREFTELKPEYNIDVDVDNIHDELTVFADVSLLDAQGKFLGVCGVGRRMETARDLFRSLESSYNVRVDLVDASGEVKINAREDAIENEKIDIPLILESGGDYVFHSLGGGKFAVTKYLERLNWYLVVQGDGSEASTRYYNVIFLNIVLCFLVMALMLAASRIIVMRTNVLTNASFRDHNTMLLNRRAFEEEKIVLLDKGVGENFIYITADINGLKTANDTLGHAAGDELIQGAAMCLKESFGAYGKVYRIGGDEFALLLNLTQEQMEECLEEFKKRMASWIGSKVKSLSVSLGYASYREFPSESITELSRISDERMYADKERYYAQPGNGQNRRKA